MAARVYGGAAPMEEQIQECPGFRYVASSIFSLVHLRRVQLLLRNCGSVASLHRARMGSTFAPGRASVLHLCKT